ncbi:TPA: hypothetical protein L4V42_002139 [Pseudomonas aeruginosa]|nr:hypothetical protein [Pseudomonas aeruginosa]
MHGRKPQLLINDRLGSRTLLASGSLVQQALCRGIPLGGLLSSLLHRLGCIPGPLFAGQAQLGNLPDLLRHCGLQLSPGGAAGNEVRPRGVELRAVVPRAEPDTAGGAEADQHQAGQRDR